MNDKTVEGLTGLGILKQIRFFQWVLSVCSDHSLPELDNLGIKRLRQSCGDSPLDYAEGPRPFQILRKPLPLMNESQYAEGPRGVVDLRSPTSFFQFQPIQWSSRVAWRAWGPFSRDHVASEVE